MLTVHYLLGLVVLQGDDLLLAQWLLELGCRRVELHWLLLGGEAWLHHLGLALEVKTILICHLMLFE